MDNCIDNFNGESVRLYSYEKTTLKVGAGCGLLGAGIGVAVALSAATPVGALTVVGYAVGAAVMGGCQGLLLGAIAGLCGDMAEGGRALDRRSTVVPPAVSAAPDLAGKKGIRAIKSLRQVAASVFSRQAPTNNQMPAPSQENHLTLKGPR